MNDEEAKIEQYLSDRGLSCSRFSKGEMRKSKTPDFRVAENDEFVFFCEVKTSKKDNWLEYKITSDQLVENLSSPAGVSAKKWFDTINLLVCHKVDDQTEGYSITEITSDNVSQRTFYGVTHLLTKDGNEHVVQVIELETCLGLIGT